ncbi:MAG: hypothetical protein IPK52_24820 [Chloroflexi bacterium]|nr:hypothetical protein [Chloroflexota bacterium]
MTSRSNRTALVILGGLMLTGIITAQNNIIRNPPEATVSPESTIFPEMTIEPEATVEFDMSSALLVEGSGIRFSVPAAVASGATAASVAAVAFDASNPLEGAAPAHEAFAFDGYMPGSEVAPYLWTSAELRVFNTADFADYTLGQDTLNFPSESAALRRILGERVELATEARLPYLPVIAPNQSFHVRERYIEFEGGSGILYLAYYSFSVDPILEGQIVAIFQGLSDDGLTYISAAMPLDTNYLLDAVPENFDYTAFSAGYESYVQSIRVGLNEQPPSLFSPGLDALEAMFTSIVIVR